MEVIHTVIPNPGRLTPEKRVYYPGVKVPMRIAKSVKENLE